MRNETDLPIGEAAWDVQQIEPVTPIRGDFDISLGASFADPILRARFARQEQTQALHSYRLQDVTLDASLMLLLRERARIPETRYLVTEGEYAATLVKPLPLERTDPGEHHIIGTTRAWDNYYHWLTQAVPAIDWGLRRRGRHRVSLVLPPLQSWQEETLALLGCQDVPRLTLNVSNHYLLHQAEFSDFLGSRTPGVVSLAAAATFRRLAASVPWTHCTAEEIYIARTDTTNRVADNEAELIDFLDGQGVRIIVPGTLAVAEQVAAFRAARLVIGPHGAGMSNIAFCQPRSFVYELLPQHYPNACFNRIAQAAGLNYCADLFESLGEGALQRQTWRADLDVVAARLATLRARITVTRRVEPAMHFLKRTQQAQPDDTALPVQAPEPPVAASEPPRPHGRFARFAGALARPFSRRRAP